MMETAMSKVMENYFSGLDLAVKKCYDAGNLARSRGFDPEDRVCISLAKNMAERVVGLVSTIAPQIKGSGICERIGELEEQYGMQDWRVAMQIALEVAQEKFCKFRDKKEAIETGIRVGFAYTTVGVVSSPLEGFLGLDIMKRNDGGGEYFRVSFGGPVRSAGGTGASTCVIVADYVRKKLGYAKYDPTQEEIKRTYSELEYYHDRVSNLQYFPFEREASFLTEHIPIQIDGSPSEKFEVPNYRDLPRVSTNILRNGFCLMIAEGLIPKSAKLWKQLQRWGAEMEMEDWNFFGDFVKLQKELRAKGVGGKKEESEKIKPDYTYIKDLVAGRPVLAHPLRSGAFRIRLGRARTSGFSSDAVHPATMVVLGSYVAIGTQLKTERPGKSTVISSCDTIEGPVVKLKSGDVLYLDSVEEAKRVLGEIEEIIYCGDILVDYGYFLNRAHRLVPVGYNEDWWEQEVRRSGGVVENKLKVSFSDAVEISKSLGVAFYPRYTYHFSQVSADELRALADWLGLAVFREEKIIFPLVYDSKSIEMADPKRILEILGVPHKVVSSEFVVVEGDYALGLMVCFGCLNSKYNKERVLGSLREGLSVLEMVNLFSAFKIKDRSGTFIGSRMGRPEKAKMRKMTGSPHVLFPVGSEGGRLRCFQSCLENGKVSGQFNILYCSKCGCESVYRVCHKCGGVCEEKYYCRECKAVTEKRCEHECAVRYKQMEINIREYFDDALRRIGTNSYPELIKGVRGTSNKEHIPEHLVKGILRAANGIYVNKDGTTRYDMTEMAITHFKPVEIGTSVERLRELGYNKDIFGNELTGADQILEIRPQDIILPSCPESLDEGADSVLFRVACFVDDLLEKLYGVERFYRLQKKSDLVGHLVIGLSPHTSAGIVARVIGFSKTQGFFAHPYLHSIMRRDIDGDEAGVMLMMDAFLNFSLKLIGAHRGATQDEPLVLTSNIIPAEVDDMIFDMDIMWEYPLELYEACLEYKQPWDVEMNIIKKRLGESEQYEGFGFTHDTSNINLGVRCSSYKTIPTMEEKVSGQMALAEKLRCVDESDVARLLIERHFMRDIRGNLRKFSMQQFRCVQCNEKYRRPPLKGICLKCSGRIIFTISEGSVVKYLEPSISLAEKYVLPHYLKQTLELTKQRVELVFGKEPDRQEWLGKWFG